MLRSKSIKKYISIAQKNQSTAQDDIFMKPDSSKVIGMRHGSYDKLNDKGYVPEETMIYNGDIILGKVTPIEDTGDSNKQFKDSSEVYKSHATAVIDKVYTGIQNQDGYEIRKVVTRSERTPMIGDKFCLPVDSFEVLTDNGWKPFLEVTLEDKIATLVDDSILEYQQPINIYKFNYKGDMYKVRSEKVDLDTTMDHDLYVKLTNLTNQTNLTNLTNQTYQRISAEKVYNLDKMFRCGKDNMCDEEFMITSEHESMYKFEGEVGCLEVPSHVFMIRQNNKNVWIGNCSRYG
jgi:DNA-directed RNA polymerase II subunit RPB2